jgi:hopene-associated glycosyltransferase HpnB
MLIILILAVTAVVAWGYLSLGHGLFWVPLLPKLCIGPQAWPSVDIIVPARNEADALPTSLPSLLSQDYAGDWRVILVNDHSTDRTSEIALKIATDLGKSDRLTVINAPDLPAEWVGKVAAMNAGATASNAAFILFTDADIRHAPASLHQLVARAEARKLDLVSRMVKLNCASFAEKLLIPPFVFFFAMLYPFRRSNSPRSKVAAAAGGTMLIRRAMLVKIGGLACIKSALIDDCSLARAVKDGGGSIELMLTNSIQSLRPYPHITDVWGMVSRTAYTQLRYSPLLLLGTIAGMTVLYILPPALLLLGTTWPTLALGMLGWLMLTLIYMPMVRFYGLNRAWALTLPLAAFVYGAATLDSARLYHQGKGGQWKGRSQA